MSASPSPPGNLVLRQLQGLRAEFAAVLENQRRDRELIVRLDRHMEGRFDRIDQSLDVLRRECRKVKSDVVLLDS